MTVVDEMAGALLIEVCLACILYGVTTLQMFIYYQTFSKDSRFLKGVVGTVWGLESVHTALCMVMVYAYTVSHFGDHEFLGRIYWGAGASILVGVFISALVHAFYIRRVWIMSSGSIPVTAVIALLALCRFGSGIGSFALSLEITDWTLFRANASPLVTIALGLGCASAVDVLVSLTLSYYIRRDRGNWERGSQEGDSRIDTILVYAVNTGAITAIASLLSVVLFATQKQSLVFLGLVEIQSKLYANSFLGSLNVRAIGRDDAPTNGSSFPAYRLPQRASAAAGIPRFRTPGSLEFTVPEISVHQQTVVMHDGGDVDAYSQKSIKAELVY